MKMNLLRLFNPFVAVAVLPTCVLMHLFLIFCRLMHVFFV